MKSKPEVLLFLTLTVSVSAAPPAVGNMAPDFALPNLEGVQVRLSQISAKRPVVLVVLRGYPGYQCPYCTRQVQDFVKHAEGFDRAGVAVVLIYPGPSDGLAGKASEFVAGKHLPERFVMLLDPDYEFTNLYGLRWDAPGETAHPSTYLLDEHGRVFYAKVSSVHGGRTSAAEVLEALGAQK